MTKAIILSAGQGRRLLPLTENCPKCMLEIAGKSVLQWQLDALLACNVTEISIITGFHSEQVENLLDSNYADKPQIGFVFNPFFNVSDNLASCWLARQEMNEDFLLINGDTVYETSLLEHVLKSESAPVTLTIDFKEKYDEDDMKVTLEDRQVKGVSKILSPEQTHAESIGMLYFRGDGPRQFRNSVENAMRKPSGLKSWFLSVVDAMARDGKVTSCSISGHRWAEIDFIHDLESAQEILAPSNIS
ncbi:MAG: NTP transferase domain-containing protein [Gammaproteobacteria bacterium]|nr:NTP transferase domain-containing protein [Gammaproteobacteria bacterium]